MSYPHHRREAYRSNFTYVSPCVKYLIFLLNFVFWVSGLSLLTTELVSGSWCW